MDAQVIPLAAVEMSNDEVVMGWLDERLDRATAEGAEVGHHMNTSQAINWLAWVGELTQLQMLALQLRHHVI